VITQARNGKQDIGPVNFGRMENWLDEIDIYGSLFTENDVCFNGDKNCVINITTDSITFNVPFETFTNELHNTYFFKHLVSGQEIEYDTGWLEFSDLEDDLNSLLYKETKHNFLYLLEKLGIDDIDMTNTTLTTIFEDYVGGVFDFVSTRWANTVDDKILPLYETGIEEYRWYELKRQWYYRDFTFAIDYNRKNRGCFITMDIDSFNELLTIGVIKNYSDFIIKFVVKEINDYDISDRFYQEFDIDRDCADKINNVVMKFIQESIQYINFYNKEMLSGTSE
jgi:hypothetical protein